MRINWFKDENHLVYINGATQLAELERTLHFPGLDADQTEAAIKATVKLLNLIEGDYKDLESHV